MAESNRMENIDTSPSDLRELTVLRTELLEMSVGGMIQHIREDPRMLESLGLYRAYAIADEWADNEARPREFEVRALHGLVMPTLSTGGSYKTKPNKIGGSALETASPWDVAQEMDALVSWFREGSGDAVLDAAVAHAWLSQIHPFDDGNGRMARLIANLALVQAKYPPLLLRSGADRGEYLDALGMADQGDILPLYNLFVSALRRAVKTMERPGYVRAKINAQLLQTSSQRYEAWKSQLHELVSSLETAFLDTGWSLELMGVPSLEDFALLEQRDADGNGWFLRIRHKGEPQWLLWFGFQSDDLSLTGRLSRVWPSIFWGRRANDPTAVHPYENRTQSAGERPAEIAVVPGSNKPVTMRWGNECVDYTVLAAAAQIVRAMEAPLQIG